MAHTMDGGMNYAIDAVERRFQPSAGSKINTGTPAC
jgi:hypothetical protein